MKILTRTPIPSLRRSKSDRLLAIPREVGKSPATALSNRYLQAMLDEEDLEIYQRLLGDC
jgi:hypothetical protein